MKLRIWRVPVKAVLCMVLTIALTAPAWAAKVKITGAQAAIFDQTTGSFTFAGPVTITDGTTTIEGEYVVYQAQQEILEFRGPVRMTQDDTTIKGYDLVYNLNNRDGSIKQALGSVTPAGATSPVYVLGDKVTTCKQRTSLEGAKLTTCDPENPGYYMSSRTIEIYPGDKLVLYHVRFVESGITLFYWPRVTFSLKRADPNQASEAVSLPKVGYSSTEGWYIKSSFGYRGPGEQRGRILIDYMQLLGWGYGITHTLRVDNQGSEKIDVYAQPKKNTGHIDTQVAFTEQRTFKGNLQVLARSAYSSTYTSGEQQSMNNQLTLSQGRSEGSTSLSFHDTRLKGVSNGYETLGNVYHAQNLGNGWKLNVNGSVDKRERQAVDRRNLVGYLAEVRRDTSDWSMGLVIEDRFNPELAKDVPSEVTWNQARRLPEITLQVNRLSLAGWETPFALDAAWGRLSEDDRLADTGRSDITRTHIIGKLKPMDIDLGFLGSLNWSGSMARDVYGTGEAQWVAGSQARYRLAISDRLTLRGDYQYAQAFGDASPFYFDRVVDQEKVQGRIDYATTPLQIALSSGYDFINAAPLDVVGSIRLQPSSALRLQAQGAYSLLYSDWLYVVGTAQYTPDAHLSLNVGAKYNLPELRVERVDAVMQWDLGHWQLGYTGIYDGTKNKFDRGDFTITRDLGCRAIDLRYNQNRKEVWLEYRITAFPDASVKVGATEKHLMFDARGWEEVLATR